MSEKTNERLGDAFPEPIKDTEALGKAIVAVVNRAVKIGTGETTSGNYILRYEDFKDLITGADFRKHLSLIVTELVDREEVIEVEADPERGELNCIFGLAFCPSYEWTEGDESTFGCSYEEWLDKPTDPISQPETLQTVKLTGKEC